MANKNAPNLEASAAFQKIDALLRPLESERSMLLKRRQSLDDVDSALVDMQRAHFLPGEYDALQARLTSLFEAYATLQRQRQRQKKDSDRLDNAFRAMIGKQTDWDEAEESTHN